VSNWVSASDVDPEDVAQRLGVDARRASWLLQPPSGRVQWWSAGILAVEERLVRAEEQRSIWRLLAWNCDEASLRAALSPEIPIVAAAPTRVLPPSTAPIQNWISGPDPFVDLQTVVTQFGAQHDRFGVRCAGPSWSVARDAAWWRWRYSEEPGVANVVMQIADGEDIAGLVAVRALERHGLLVVEILEIRATSPRAHYDLLKAARRFSWEQGALPVILRGEEMSRRYAFTAGYVPSTGTMTTPHAVWSPTLPKAPRMWACDFAAITPD